MNEILQEKERERIEITNTGMITEVEVVVEVVVETGEPQWVTTTQVMVVEEEDKITAEDEAEVPNGMVSLSFLTYFTT